ncbi:HD domain-containing protein [Pectinatus haikarae]|uniref:HD domain-containing protein n=1 Tax=Pectinatus haikarae TaxID=349096 RepID=UPI0018C482FB|nr:HD domain-containing protein [Pectinatus haikarae]
MTKDQVFQKMIEYFQGDPKRIQHFTKVYAYASLIGNAERLSQKQQYILEVAALMHDIGIKPAEEKYGSCNGTLQEQEGPAPAKELLQSLNADEDIIERVVYLIAHHHTYDKIDGKDYQILVEADFLVNSYEDSLPANAIKSVYNKLFCTECGRKICRDMFVF